MPRTINRLEAVATIGIDIGKNTFHLVGLDRNGAIVLRQKLSRRQVEARLANMPPCHATHGGSTHWVMCGRRLIDKSFFTLMQHWSGEVMCPAC
jgi:hypothetical protein